MKRFFPLLSSLCLAIIIGFAIPLIIISLILGLLLTISNIPFLYVIAHNGINQILQILAIFGSGFPWQGILTISLTWAFVGFLFDLFNFSLFQDYRSN